MGSHTQVQGVALLWFYINITPHVLASFYAYKIEYFIKQIKIYKALLGLHGEIYKIIHYLS
jgi:hypothetical protein